MGLGCFRGSFFDGIAKAKVRGYCLGARMGIAVLPACFVWWDCVVVGNGFGSYLGKQAAVCERVLRVQARPDSTVSTSK